MLAADAELEGRPGLAPALGGDAHQFAHPRHIQADERVLLEDAGALIGHEEAAGVVTADAVGRLRQVVGAEAEELGMLGDVVGAQGGARQLDHRAHEVRCLESGRLRHLAGDAVDQLLQDGELARPGDERDHHFRLGRLAGLLVHGGGRLEDRAHLHLVDFREGDAEPAAAMAEHRVRFLQHGGAVAHGLDIDSRRLRHVGHLGGRVRQELVQRRIEQADRYGQAAHDAEKLDEIIALHRQDLGQRSPPPGRVLGHDHLAHGDDAAVVEEHMLGTTEADALGPETPSGAGIVRRLRIRAHFQPARLVGPLHESREITRQLRLDGRHLAQHDLAGGAVDGDELAVLHRRPADRHSARLHVDPQIAGAGDARPPHAAGDDGGVAGHAAARGQDAGGGVHAVDVFRTGLDPHENDAVTLGSPMLGLVGGEGDAAAGRSRRGRKAARDHLARRLGVEGRVQQLIERTRIDAPDRLAAVDQAFAHHVDGDLERRGGRALAAARLQHPQPALLHRELDILHVPVMGFQLAAHGVQLAIELRHHLFHRRQGRLLAFCRPRSNAGVR
jgi:hypothetical protein